MIHRLITATLLVMFMATFTAGENWPQWRGPRGDGSSLDESVPTHWDGPSGKNIAWRVDLPGEGHSSPIVWGDHVFVTACVPISNEADANNNKRGKRLLICLDRTSGKQRWESVVFSGQLETIHALNSRASGTPATDGQHVYVAFMQTDGQMITAPNVSTARDITKGELVVAAFDYAGRRQWLEKPGEFISAHGFSSCPVLYKDMVIVNGDHDGKNSFVVALDKTTGVERWRLKRENGIRSYVTPLIRHAGGLTRMVFAGSNRIVSVNPDDGRLQWFLDGPTEQCVASMVYDGERFYMNCGYPDHYVVAVQPGNGDQAPVGFDWQSTKARSYVPSPVVLDGYLFVADDRGTANCFETETGDRLWQERFGGGFNASLVHANGLVYLTGKDGETSIVRPGKKLEVVTRNKLGESVSASPAISNGQLFIRGEKSLYCIVQKGS